MAGIQGRGRVSKGLVAAGCASARHVTWQATTGRGGIELALALAAAVPQLDHASIATALEAAAIWEGGGVQGSEASEQQGREGQLASGSAGGWGTHAV
jgi:hypothetical protein